MKLTMPSKTAVKFAVEGKEYTVEKGEFTCGPLELSTIRHLKSMGFKPADDGAAEAFADAANHKTLADKAIARAAQKAQQAGEEKEDAEAEKEKKKFKK